MVTLAMKAKLEWLIISYPYTACTFLCVRRRIFYSKKKCNFLTCILTVEQTK